MDAEVKEYLLSLAIEANRGNEIAREKFKLIQDYCIAKQNDPSLIYKEWLNMRENERFDQEMLQEAKDLSEALNEVYSPSPNLEYFRVVILPPSQWNLDTTEETIAMIMRLGDRPMERFAGFYAIEREFKDLGKLRRYVIDKIKFYLEKKAKGVTVERGSLDNYTLQLKETFQNTN